MGISDWEAEFNSAQTRRSSEYMEPGNFLLRVDKIAEGKNRRGVDNFKVEGTIIHKLDESGVQATGQSVCALWSRSSDFFASEVKGFVSSIMGIDSDQVTFEMLQRLAADSQPMKGTVIEFIAYKKDPEKQFVSKFCRGMKGQEETKAVLTEDEWANYSESLKFIK